MGSTSTQLNTVIILILIIINTNINTNTDINTNTTDNNHNNWKNFDFHLRTVPTIVIVHTFCASRDTGISYG